MSNIPGLLLCPVENKGGEAINLPSFTEAVSIPESHRFGNCRRIQEFQNLDKLAEGSYGSLYKCRDKRTDSIYALKKFKMPSDFRNGVPKSVLREYNILSTLKHVNIVNSHGPVSGKHLESNCLILDYCRISLKNVIDKKFPIYEHSVVKCVMQQLFQGLDYIHSVLVIHRNISKENIMFTDEGILKITGFHFSRFCVQSNMSPVQSELSYRAPELLFNSKTYDTKVDMWSSGCVFAELVMKKPIFTGNSEFEVLNSIFKILGTPNENVWQGFEVLCSHYRDGLTMIEDSKPYSELDKYIMGVTSSCYEIISYLLVYFSNVRFSAAICLKSPYFNEDPPACSTQHLASILKNVDRRC